MSEQNRAANAPQATTLESHAAVDSATAEGVLTSAYPQRRSFRRWIVPGSIIVLVVAGAFFCIIFRASNRLTMPRSTYTFTP